MTEFTYKYEMPSLTADIVVMRDNQGIVEVLTIERGNEPFKGFLALPGGFGNKGERLIETATRELNEETNLAVDEDDLIFITVVDTPGRDPRGWVVTLVFATVISMEESLNVYAGDDAVDYEWIPVEKLTEKKIAFDHTEIIVRAFMNYFGGMTYGT